MGRNVVGWSLDKIIKVGDAFFSGEDDVHETMYRLAARLREEKIPYALIGGMARTLHGFMRVTGDVDILTTREGLDAVRERLVGRGYAARARRKIEDAKTGIPIDFFITGEYPGDGKPKPVAFPHPAEAVVELNGCNVIAFPKLIELKIASGLTGFFRLHDLADVVDFIKSFRLSRDFADQLDPYVRDEYIRLWEAWKNRPTTAPDYEPGEE